MPYGKHSGKPLTAIPLDYLRWAIKTWEPSPLIDAMIAVVQERAKLTKSRISLSPRKKAPSTKPSVKDSLTVQTPHSIGETFGELKQLLENSPPDLF